jgi:hypothetical protein
MNRPAAQAISMTMNDIAPQAANNDFLCDMRILAGIITDGGGDRFIPLPAVWLTIAL